MAVIASGNISGTGALTAFAPRGPTAVAVRGAFTGSISVERSLDNGASWGVASRDSAGTPATYTAAFDLVVEPVPADVLYRLNVTSLGSGTPTWQAAG